jgi:flagella basal body P-ring formation protein FlgA
MIELLLGLAFTLASGAPVDPAVERAITTAVRDRMGADVEVIVEGARIFTTERSAESLRDESALRVDDVIAIPDPAAKVGALVRFTLVVTRKTPGQPARAVRVATAEARVRVTAAVPLASRLISRGETLTADAITTTTVPVVGAPLKRLLSASDLAGARALKDLAPGEPVTAAFVAAPPVVRSGQSVTAVSRVSGIEVSTTLVAVDAGASGEIIHVLNRESRKTMRARIVSASLVEIIQ